jgi:hypothetical protein
VNGRVTQSPLPGVELIEIAAYSEDGNHDDHHDAKWSDVTVLHEFGKDEEQEHRARIEIAARAGLVQLSTAQRGESPERQRQREHTRESRGQPTISQDLEHDQDHDGTDEVSTVIEMHSGESARGTRR